MPTKELNGLFFESKENDYSALVREIVKLSASELSTFSPQELKKIVIFLLCSGWTFKTVSNPKYSDINFYEFNDFCRKIPENTLGALGWQPVPKAPYKFAVKPKVLGFVHHFQKGDNYCSLYALNSCFSPKNQLSVESLMKRAKHMSKITSLPENYYFSPNHGIALNFQTLLIEEAGFEIKSRVDIGKSDVFDWLEEIGADRCLLGSSRVGVQFPSGLIARGPHVAAMRKDEFGKWWLIDSSNPVAVPVDFEFIHKGHFSFQAFLPKRPVNNS